MSNRRSQDPFEPDRRRRAARRREAEDRDEVTPQRRPRRRWPIVLGGLVLLVALLPNLLGWLGLHNYAVRYVAADFQGNINIGTASLGWLEPVVLGDVTATDLAGNPLATIESIKTSKPLYAFLTLSDYGEVDIHKPLIYYHVRRDGSNLEDSISRYVASSQPSPLNPESPSDRATQLPKVLLRVHDGGAWITTEGNHRAWQIDSLSATVAVSQAQAPLASTAQFRAMSLMPDSQGQFAVEESGNVLLKSIIDKGSQALSFSSANLELESEQFPLSVLGPLSQRLLGPAQIGGSATANIVAAWEGASNEVATTVHSLQISHPQVYAPRLFNEDHLVFNQLSARGTIQLSAERIFADQFHLETDFGRVDANGGFDPAQIARLSAGGQLPDATLQVEGRVDIARLLQRLPATFQLHEDLNVESGSLNFSASQRNDDDARRLVLNVDTANLKATRRGEAIVWQQPLRIVGVLRESGGQFSIESLECVSGFLNVNGSATLREGMFRATGNLGELSRRIGQFADLGPTQFAGSLDGQFGWKVISDQQVNLANLANEPIQLGGEFTVTEPVIELVGMPRWSPDKIVIRTSGSGKLTQADSRSSLSLSQGGVQMIVGSESSTLSLARPVEDAFTNRQWVFNTQVSGQLAGWLQHVRNFVDPGDFQAAGSLDFAGVTIVDADAIRVENGQYEVRQLAFDGYGAKIREEKVVGAVTAEYGLGSGDLGVAQATLQGSGISATAQNLQLTTGPSMQLEGSAAWRADINRLAQWLSLSTQVDSVNWFGALEGTADFSNAAGGTEATFRAELTDLVATQKAAAVDRTSPMQMVGSRQAWTELWREPRVKLDGQLGIGSDFDSLTMHSVSARSGSLDFDVRGTVSDLAGSVNTNLAGQWQPNFEKINSLLAAYSQNMVSLSGNGVQPFRMQGPLFAETGSNAVVSDQLVVQTAVAWDRGQLAGLPIGKSDIGIDLQQQVATLRTGESGIPLAGGAVILQPQLDLRSGDPVLLHGPGRLLDGAQLTPEICRDVLKFVAPWLSDTTHAQGVFSWDLEGMKMPLFDPTKVSARGTLVMQDVTVAAGPMAEQLLGAVAQVQAILKPESRERELKTWLKIEQQEIPLAVENGRVYHEGIKFSHEELVIRTSGSVGFDQSVSLVAKIPIAEQWIEGNRYLSGLQGQSISVPVGGTVERPVIDQRAVQKLSADLVKNAAQGAIKNAIGEQLNPKLNQVRDQLNNKIRDELGGFLQDQLGVPGGRSAAPRQPAVPGQQIEDRLNGELKKGLNRLFGG